MIGAALQLLESPQHPWFSARDDIEGNGPVYRGKESVRGPRRGVPDNVSDGPAPRPCTCQTQVGGSAHELQKREMVILRDSVRRLLPDSCPLAWNYRVPGRPDHQ